MDSDGGWSDRSGESGRSFRPSSAHSSGESTRSFRPRSARSDEPSARPSRAVRESTAAGGCRMSAAANAIGGVHAQIDPERDRSRAARGANATPRGRRRDEGRRTPASRQNATVRGGAPMRCAGTPAPVGAESSGAAVSLNGEHVTPASLARTTINDRGKKLYRAAVLLVRPLSGGGTRVAGSC